ncbi:MAG: NAD+ synthase [Firmicutes bacterium]|nr:NAD+ synthase [Bacillota bacterium]MDH7496574.1 NAD+ synthase [Bacillota bacterium]
MQYGSINVPGLELDLEEVQAALVEFVQVQVALTGYKKVVINLSGGLDSSVVLYLCVQAIGPENVFGAMLPYRTSDPASLADAKQVAAILGIDYCVMDISGPVDAYFAALPPEADPCVDRLRRGNRIARERMAAIYDLSAAKRGIVAGTSNKTELLLGYGTLHGDLAFAFDPIGDLYKTQVRALARHLGVPAGIIAKPPSADLWVGQTDEGELGFTYDDVDKLLYLMIDERRKKPDLVAQGFSPEFIDAVERRVKAMRFKARMPVLARVMHHGVGGDFRYWESTTSRRRQRRPMPRRR